MRRKATKLVVNVGSMFSGKSSELLRQGLRHTYRKEKVLYIKPETDTRYSDMDVVTHDGKSVPAKVVHPHKYFLNQIPIDVDVVLIDEVQFFSKEVIHVIQALLMSNVTVYCSGLDMTFGGSPFGVTPQLMAMADEVNKLHAVCADCGEDGYISYRISRDKELVKLGSGEEYIPLCRRCYYDKIGDE